MSQSATIDQLAIARDARLDGHFDVADQVLAHLDVDFAYDATQRPRSSAASRRRDREMRKFAHRIRRHGGEAPLTDLGINLVADPNVPPGRIYMMGARRDTAGAVVLAEARGGFALIHPETLATLERRDQSAS